MGGRVPAMTLPANRPTWDDGPSAFTDLLVVFGWPLTSSARSYPARVARSLAAKLGRPGMATVGTRSWVNSSRPAPSRTCCRPEMVSAVLTGMASRGAHVLVVSMDGEAADAELRGLGLHRHVAGVALDVRNLAGYLLDHRCRRDRAMFVGHRERDLVTAARVGYEIVGLCDSSRSGKRL
jgi:hypothetical protein